MAERGTKLTCAHCAVRFYDLNKTAVTCPACGGVYKPPVVVPRVPRTARGRAQYPTGRESVVGAVISINVAQSAPAPESPEEAPVVDGPAPALSVAEQ